MINKLKILCIAVLTLIVNACSIDEIEVFADVDYVYFPIANPILEVVDDNGYLEKHYTFVYSNVGVNEEVFSLPIQLAGLPNTTDRNVSFQVNDEYSTAIEGTHFELLSANESFIPANQIDGNIRIKLLKTPEMANQNFKIAIDISDNEYLKAGPQGSCVLNVSDFLTKPSWWGISYNSFLGEFTMKKCALWFKYMDVSYGVDPWEFEPYVKVSENSDGDIIYVADDSTRRQSVQAFVLWLMEGDENGDPYMDENGVLVTDTI